MANSKSVILKGDRPGGIRGAYPIAILTSRRCSCPCHIGMAKHVVACSCTRRKKIDRSRKS